MAKKANGLPVIEKGIPIPPRAQVENAFRSGIEPWRQDRGNGQHQQARLMKSLTELEALVAQRGYELKVFTADGEEFSWRYRGDTDVATLQEAVAMSLRNYADRYFCIQITPCEMPAKIESDPGAYYARKEKEARELSERLDEARKANAPQAEIWKLERALERAYYVGD